MPKKNSNFFFATGFAARISYLDERDGKEKDLTFACGVSGLTINIAEICGITLGLAAVTFMRNYHPPRKKGVEGPRIVVHTDSSYSYGRMTGSINVRKKIEPDGSIPAVDLVTAAAKEHTQKLKDAGYSVSIVLDPRNSSPEAKTADEVSRTMRKRGQVFHHSCFRVLAGGEPAAGQVVVGHSHLIVDGKIKSIVDGLSLEILGAETLEKAILNGITPKK